MDSATLSACGLGRWILALALCIVCLPVHPTGAAEGPAQRERDLAAVVAGSGDWAAKDAACRELRSIGTPACVPALATLLTDPKLSHSARYALEPMPFPEAGEALRQALAQTRGEVRLGLLASIGFRRDPEAVPVLLPLLADADSATVAAAAATLGRIGSPEAATALDALRARTPPALRLAVGEASLAAAEHLLAHGHREHAERIYADLRGAAWPRHVRLGAFSGSLSAQPETAFALLIGAITGDDPELRGTAIAAARLIPGEAVTAGMAAELPRLPAATQVLLVDALAARGPAVTRAILEAGMATDDASVRIACAKAVASGGDAACVPWLAGVAAGARTGPERDAAAQALVLLAGGAATNEALRQATAAAEPEVRPRLIDVIMRREDPEAGDTLLREARAGNEDVRRAAFRALGRLGRPEELPAILQALLATPDDDSRREAERTVGLVARMLPDPEARPDPLLRALTAQRDVGLRCSLLRALGAVGGAKALPVVRQAMASDDERERDAGVRALAAWPDPGGAEALLEVARSAPSDVHRMLALRGLVRLLTPPTDLALEARLDLYRRAVPAAAGADARKLLLGGLMQVPHPEALRLSAAWLGEIDVAREAAVATLKLAETVLAADVAGTAAALRTVAEKAPDENTRKAARELLGRAEGFADYVVGWLISGPYAQGGKTAAEIYDVPFAPEQDNGEGAVWRLLPAVGRPQQPWMLVLTNELDGSHCAGYLRTWVRSPRAMTVAFEAGVDDAMRMWVNGREAYGRNSSGAAVPAEEKGQITLNEGWNLLLVKVLQHSGPAEFCLRLCTAEGKPVEGLTVEPLHQIPGGTLGSREPAANEAPTPAPPSRRLAPPPAGEEGWVPLFNGRDLSGWEQTGKGVFKVEDGCLIGTQTDGQGGDLWHPSEWQDFELRATYRVGWPANTGVWFRHHQGKGYQFDVLKYTKPVAYSGSLYCPGKMFLTVNLRENLENRDGWNEAVIRARGDEITLWLNGTEVGYCRDTTSQRGRVGIQVHGGDGFKGMVAAFRRLEVRPLPATERE
ncbi:MAG: DUF1080 domain-containing protein [Lentisphaeria bacterium]|nr:DUF1080 domain-containing protein [Lentisphaeria bacterium]